MNYRKVAGLRHSLLPSFGSLVQRERQRMAVQRPRLGRLSSMRAKRRSPRSKRR